MSEIVQILGYDVHAEDLGSITIDAGIINTINPHSYCVSTKDDLFRGALQQSDILLPDGIGIVLASKILAKRKIIKIAGYDVFIHLLKKLDEQKGSCFFLGASQDSLEKIENKLNQEYPNVSVGSFSPPFRAEFSPEEDREMVKAINGFSPDVLFVGMTAPKQEKWVHRNKAAIDVKTICSIGAVFDFYAGNTPRAPKIYIRLGMEWFYRSLKSRRLLVRNMTSNPKFVFTVIKTKFLAK